MKICKYKIKQYYIYNFIFFKLKYGNINQIQIQDMFEYPAVFIIAFGAKSVSSVFAIDHNILLYQHKKKREIKY